MTPNRTGNSSTPPSTPADSTSLFSPSWPRKTRRCRPPPGAESPPPPAGLALSRRSPRRGTRSAQHIRSPPRHPRSRKRFESRASTSTARSRPRRESARRQHSFSRNRRSPGRGVRGDQDRFERRLSGSSRLLFGRALPDRRPRRESPRGRFVRRLDAGQDPPAGPRQDLAVSPFDAQDPGRGLVAGGRARARLPARSAFRSRGLRPAIHRRNQTDRRRRARDPSLRPLPDDSSLGRPRDSLGRPGLRAPPGPRRAREEGLFEPLSTRLRHATPRRSNRCRRKPLRETEGLHAGKVLLGTLEVAVLSFQFSVDGPRLRTDG